MTTSHAAVMEAPGRIALREFDVPNPEPGVVVIAMHLSGICGTDKHTFRGECKQYAGTPHERDLEYPLICGHENVGTVVATGGPALDSDGVRCRKATASCPGPMCHAGVVTTASTATPTTSVEHLEDYGNSLNVGRYPSLFGGWSRVHVPAAAHADLPGARGPARRGRRDDRGDGRDARRRQGHRCARPARWFTLGLLGRGAGYGAPRSVSPDQGRMLGAGMVIATDVLEGRLQFADKFGVDLALNASETDADERSEAILDATHGRGVDLVLDCSGVPSTFTEALKVVRTGGVVVEAGAFVDMGPVQMNPNSDICTRNVAVLGIGGELATEYEPSMRLMAANLDRYPLTSITTHILPMDRAQEAVMLAQSGEAMQVAVDPRLPLTHASP